MSRHEFSGKDGATNVTIGWDRPLDTFFVQVFACNPGSDGEETVIVWEGVAPNDLPTAADAIRIAAPYAMLPSDLGATLETDRLKTLGAHDGVAQIAVKPLLNRSRGY